MKKIKIETLAKILILLLVFFSFAFSALTIRRQLNQAAQISPETVESYRFHLNTNLVRQAAQAIVGETN